MQRGLSLPEREGNTEHACAQHSDIFRSIRKRANEGSTLIDSAQDLTECMRLNNNAWHQAWIFAVYSERADNIFHALRSITNQYGSILYQTWISVSRHYLRVGDSLKRISACTKVDQRLISTIVSANVCARVWLKARNFCGAKSHRLWILNAVFEQEIIF